MRRRTTPWQRSKLTEDVSRTALAWQAGRTNAVGYEASKTGKSRATVKKTVKKVGSSRKRVERRLER